MDFWTSPGGALVINLASSVLWDGGKAFGRAARERTRGDLARLRDAIAAGADVDVAPATLSAWLHNEAFWYLVAGTQADDRARALALEQLRHDFLPGVPDDRVARVVSILLMEVSLQDVPLRQRLAASATTHRFDVLEHSLGYVMSELLDAIDEVSADLDKGIEDLRKVLSNGGPSDADRHRELVNYLTDLEAWAEGRLRSLWGLEWSVIEFENLMHAWHVPRWSGDHVVRYTDGAGKALPSVLDGEATAVLTGPAGSGKSIALVSALIREIRLARTALADDTSRVRARVPVFVRSGELLASHKSFPDLCSDPSPVLMVPGLAAWVWDNRTLDVLVVLDALDECILDDERLGDLVITLRSRPGTRIVASSRARPAMIDRELHVEWSRSGLKASFLAYLEAIVGKDVVLSLLETITSGAVQAMVRSPLDATCLAFVVAGVAEIDSGLKVIEIERAAIDAILARQADRVSARYRLDSSNRGRLVDLARQYLAAHTLEAQKRGTENRAAPVSASPEIESVASAMFDHTTGHGSRRLLHATFEAHLCALSLSQCSIEAVKLALASGEIYAPEIVAHAVVLSGDRDKWLALWLDWPTRRTPSTYSKWSGRSWT